MAPASEQLNLRFGAVVRTVRAHRGWSQEQLALRAGLNRSYMSEIERAVVAPSLVTAAKLAQALGVPLSHLIQRCEGLPAQEPSADLVGDSRLS